MPSFQSPLARGKRKHSYDESNLPQSKRAIVTYETENGPSGNNRRADVYWIVQWRNPQYKKHKTWDGDAVLIVRGEWCELQDTENGQKIAFGKPLGIDSTAKISVGSQFSIGGKECEVDCSLVATDYLSGRCFANGLSPAQDPTESKNVPAVRNSAAAAKQFVPLRPKNGIGGFKPPTFGAGPSRLTEPEGNYEQKGDNPLSSQEPSLSQKSSMRESYWTANWRKPQQKKHKTWDGDAFVVLKNGTLTLVSDRGIVMGVKKWDGEPLQSGWNSFINGKEVELDSPTRPEIMPVIKGRDVEYENEVEFGSPPRTPIKEPVLLGSKSSGVTVDASRVQTSPILNAPSAGKPYVPPSSFYGSHGHKPAKPKPVGPLHDPDAEGAIVMKDPGKEYHVKHNKRKQPVIPVVIDPILGRRMRPHQIEGVKFMYECVMGMHGHDGRGCILADEMGMGKTLQTITLIWTLLKQNQYANIGPVVGKVMIVCPVSLVNNWKNEFHKWLGRDRVGVFVGDKDKQAIRQFINSRIHHVLIIGYERLRTVIADLQYCIPPIGLIICDEGHRLKSANNKTSQMFEVLKTSRRIILSGTPIQNDLSEFHSMADFCNPGLLNDYNNFRKLYEAPILKSRAPGCSAKDKEIGEARMQQLMETAKTFVLRREASILKNYLPPKHEYVVFITPTPLQRDIFNKILSADKLDSLVRGSTIESLALIGMLTKISNSPILLKATADKAKEKGDKGKESEIVKRDVVREALALMPSGIQVEDVSLSGKLTALARLMRCLYKETNEKLIVVSHYTSTLNIIEAYCKKIGYTYHRLDGSTQAQKRQQYVNEFNRTPQKQRFLFLLSSKAGGVGLNLIGASRLCLIDSDWNPSHDLQSMARIHRDGQKRPVFIYRFLTAGSIDEKIYQRQVTKLGLSNSLLGNGGSESKSDSFTSKELRDIFTIYPNTSCHTHELLECPCGNSEEMKALRDVEIEDDFTDEDSEGNVKQGFMQASQVKPEYIEKLDKEYLRQKKAQLAALGQWTHINCLKPTARETIQDSILQKLVYVPEKNSASQRDSAARKSQSRLDSLLEAVDLETVLHATAPPLPVSAVPGGSVSFLFERTSKTPLDETIDNDQEDDAAQ